MGMCLNRKVLIGLGIVAVGVLIVAPQAFVAALPVLFLLVCPLSMVFMMRGMGRNQSAAEHTGNTSHSAGSSLSAAPTTQDQSTEITRLRAEVDQLRAAAQERQHVQHASGGESDS